MWLKWSIVAGLVAGLLLSAKLWVSTREYPMVPLLGFVPPLPYPLDYLLFGLFGVLLIGILCFRGHLAGAFVIAALALAVLLVLQDQGSSNRGSTNTPSCSRPQGFPTWDVSLRRAP